MLIQNMAFVLQNNAPFLFSNFDDDCLFAASANI